MNVSEAVRERRSVRAYLDQVVPRDLIEHLVVAAARSPSGGNLQPWSIDVVLGGKLDELKVMMRDRSAQAAQDETLDFNIYPQPLADPFNARRREIGESLYFSLGIPRIDREGRRRWFMQNYQLFDAPAAIFIQVDRSMGPPQWADLGMFLQTFLLLCAEAGLGTCAQECWALYPRTMGKFLNTPPDLMLFCGIAVGYEDTAHPSASLRSPRAPVENFIRVHE